MRGIWVNFDSFTINRVLGLTDRDNDECRDLFHSPDYTKIMEKVAAPNTTWRTKRERELLDITRESLLKRLKPGFIS